MARYDRTSGFSQDGLMLNPHFARANCLLSTALPLTRIFSTGEPMYFWTMCF